MEKRALILVLLLPHIYLFLLCMTSLVVDGLPRGIGAGGRKSAIHSIPLVFTIRIRGRLQSRKGCFLEILNNGTVQGTHNPLSPYILVELRSYNTTLKRLYGVKSGRYVAMKKTGRVHGLRKVKNNSLLIEYHEENSYVTYRFLNFNDSNSDHGYFAIKENGHVRRGDTTKLGMESSQFLFLRAEYSSK